MAILILYYSKVNTSKKIFIVMPAYNEWSKIESVIDELRQWWFLNIVVADDWSKDNTRAILKKTWVYFASHQINRWAWAATQTWIDLALSLWADIVVTIDADWQHYPEDAMNLANEITAWWWDVVIWSRFLEKRKVPFLRKVFNRIWNIITWFFFWAYVTDSQSWLKAFSRSALEKIKIESNWFEFCSEIIQKIHVYDLKFKEIPISVKYTEYSQSKWQNFFNWVKTVWKLALHSLIK